MTVTFVFARICSGKQKHSKIPSFVGTSPLYIRKRPFEKNRKKTCYSLDILFMCKARKKASRGNSHNMPRCKADFTDNLSIFIHLLQLPI